MSSGWRVMAKRVLATIVACAGRKGFKQHKGAKPSAYKLVFVPIPTDGHESWVTTERDAISNASGKNVFCEELMFRGKAHSCGICKNRNVSKCRVTSL